MQDEILIHKEYKLYSQAAIALAAFFGAPFAASILIQRNCINLGNERQGLMALIIGIVSTALIFIGIFSMPEHLIDKIPNFLIPAVYTTAIYFIVEKIQGVEIKQHKNEGNNFYSLWRAVGIGSVCLVGIIAVILAWFFIIPDDFNTVRYDTGIEQFNRNEEDAMKLYSMMESNVDDYQIVDFIQKTGIPKWQENLIVLDELDTIEELPEEFQIQNNLLREYTLLRIKSYELISKSISEDTTKYDNEMDEIYDQINILFDYF